MCFRVECKQCGKYSWSGCGDHVASLYANIEKGKHCMCRSWPGVVVPTETETTAPKQQSGGASASESGKI
ncbi:hypothetical protein BVC80_1831g158 [Macleaya cordata]|uniref:Uncharacterized protein n=1 Tax=Macleaya cordata TaxID=56857 RepID=A0A200R7D4_MACCD|nr:hypothetical protein BVC80_1831g158 [Macleaya cordata]